VGLSKGYRVFGETPAKARTKFGFLATKSNGGLYGILRLGRMDVIRGICIPLELELESGGVFFHEKAFYYGKPSDFLAIAKFGGFEGERFRKEERYFSQKTKNYSKKLSGKFLLAVEIGPGSLSQRSLRKIEEMVLEGREKFLRKTAGFKERRFSECKTPAKPFNYYPSQMRDDCQENDFFLQNYERGEGEGLEKSVELKEAGSSFGFLPDWLRDYP